MHAHTVSPLLRRATDGALVAVFGLALALPAGRLALRGPGDPGFEQRRLAAPPHLRRGLAAFPKQFDAWFSDHFGYRWRLIRWQAWVKLRCLATSTHRDVTLGRDGWLYYGTTRGSTRATNDANGFKGE